MRDRAREWGAEAASASRAAALWTRRARAMASRGAAGDATRLAERYRRRAARLHARERWATRPLDELSIGCGTPTANVFACGCHRRFVEQRCDMRLTCERCRRRWCRRLRARLRQSIGDGPRKGTRLYLVTLTPPGHSGDVGTDRDRVQAAWRTWRRWLARHLRGAPRYVRVWETTAGRDGQGHAHAHVLLYARWLDYGAAFAAWRRATERWGLGNLDIQLVRNGVQGAVKYLSKYASKGIDLDSMSAETAGATLVAWYGRRMVSASRGFWAPYVPACKRCGEGWRRCEPTTDDTMRFVARANRAREILAAWTGPPLSRG